LAQQIENKGVSTTVAQPTDVESLHTKDVGIIPNGKKSFDLKKFVETYRQPPLSRFFATVDLDKVEDGPNVKKSEYKPVKNPAFKRALKLDMTFVPDGGDYVSMKGRQFNSFDIEVLRAAMLIAKMVVIQRFEKTLMNYSEVENKFSMVWEGERNNVF
jgi:hypothetical protein